jgi:hypothetical protein
MPFLQIKRLTTHKTSFRHRHEQGLAMAIVLMASAIAATTTVAVAMRSYNSYVNGTRQSLANRAKEAAEAGLNILIESLNQDHPEWLIEPYNGNGTWSISRAATGGCRQSVGVNPTVEGTSNNYSNGTKGRYKLAKYSFQGNNFYGGVGSFEVEGEIRSSDSSGNKLLASAKIYQDMSIIAKACNALPGDTSDEDMQWPGILIGSQIDRFVNTRAYIKGSDPMEPANIMCMQECLPEDEDKKDEDWESDFPPEPTIGNIEKPPAQEFPEDLIDDDLKGLSKKDMKKLEKSTLKKCKNLKIPEDIPDKAKRQDSDGTWHVYFKDSSTISINGKTCKGQENPAVKIQGENPVRLYLDSGLTIGSKTWIDTTDTKHAADFMILGTPKQKRNIEFRGVSPNGEPLKTFIWAPNVSVKFQKGERTIEGAIWADELYAVGNDVVRGFDLALPEDMPQMIYQRLGREFGIGQRDYVAQGVTSWRSYGRTP